MNKKGYLSGPAMMWLFVIIVFVVFVALVLPSALHETAKAFGTALAGLGG